MNSIVTSIMNKSGILFFEGVSEHMIEKVEKQLDTVFHSEYKEYLKHFGAASFDSHELTGICKAERLNVIYVTIKERKKNNNIPMNYYVIEETHMDGIVIWQSPTGEIYQSSRNSTPIKICNSLLEYIDL